MGTSSQELLPGTLYLLVMRTLAAGPLHGYAIARRLLQSGASVSLWDLDVDAMAEAALELSKIGPVHVAQVDVTDEASVNTAASGRACIFPCWRPR